MELTKNQIKIIDYLKKSNEESPDEYVSPTKIGLDLTDRKMNSNWASRICLELVKLGLIERSNKGHYRILV